MTLSKLDQVIAATREYLGRLETAREVLVALDDAPAAVGKRSGFDALARSLSGPYSGRWDAPEALRVAPRPRPAGVVAVPVPPGLESWREPLSAGRRARRFLVILAALTAAGRSTREADVRAVTEALGGRWRVESVARALGLKQIRAEGDPVTPGGRALSLTAKGRRRAEASAAIRAYGPRRARTSTTTRTRRAGGAAPEVREVPASAIPDEVRTALSAWDEAPVEGRGAQTRKRKRRALVVLQVLRSAKLPTTSDDVRAVLSSLGWGERARTYGSLAQLARWKNAKQNGSGSWVVTARGREAIREVAPDLVAGD